jgi:uncharacterized protein (DUF1778 family)
VQDLNFEDYTDERVRRAAAITGEPVQEFIRRAVIDRADETLDLSLRGPVESLSGYPDFS